MKVFRDRLQLTLEAARISQAEAARVARINVSHLNDMLRGRRKNVSAEIVVRLSRALGCTSDWLLGLTTTGPTPAGVRHAVALAGGHVLERAGVARMDPINVNAGLTARRGLVRKPSVASDARSDDSPV